MTDFTNISSRAMLVHLQISNWAARKHDKKVTRKTNEAHAAVDKASRTHKHLFADCEVHSRVCGRVGAAREVHYSHTLPWTDEGWRLLPTANYMVWLEAVRKALAEFDQAADAFADEYPTLVLQAQKDLGKMWNANDYPSRNSVRRKFAWHIDYRPVPNDVADVRTELPAEHVAVIEQQLSTQLERATREAMTDAWRRLHEAVARVQKASGPDGIVRPGLIDNLRETCDILSRLNLSHDADLDTLRERALRDLAVIEETDLRKDDKLRKDTQRRANDIMSAMGAFYAPPPANEESAA